MDLCKVNKIRKVYCRGGGEESSGKRLVTMDWVV